jgi:hypothetical protein
MTSQGSAYARFTRALERARTTGNPQLAWIAATELRHVALEEALALVLVARSDARFERGAAKWVAKLTIETSGVDLARLQLAAAALRATPDPLALQTLAALCEELGLDRVAHVAERFATPPL